jgi:DNA-nicking Smr family endonuclease
MNSSPRRRQYLSHPAEKSLPRQTAQRVGIATPTALPTASLRSFAALEPLRATLQAETEQREQTRLAKRQREFAAEAASSLFRRAIGHVQPLNAAKRALAEKAPPAPLPLPLQRRRAATTVLNETISDDYTPPVQLDAEESILFCQPGVADDVARKLRRGAWIVQAQIDLHGMCRDEAREALSQFLCKAIKHGLRCVRVIHGKGLGSPNQESVLKDRVVSWLAQKKEVVAFCQARPHDGGAGAVLVLLRSTAR